MNKTSIEWAEISWNPVTGCTHAGTPGCDHCYAKRVAARLKGRYGYPADDPFRVTLRHDRLNQPPGWRKPSIVFVCSMGDLFHKDVPDEFIAQVWGRMSAAAYGDHTYLVLTKRAERMAMWLNNCAEAYENRAFIRHCASDYIVGSSDRWPLSNVWLGTSIENQAAANERIPYLLRAPAVKRFVSCEPLLSEIRFNHHWLGACDAEDHEAHGFLDWVIAGCESGPNRRKADIEWFRNLRDQCQLAGTPYFLKQMDINGKLTKMPMLDGRVWDELPVFTEKGKNG